MYGMRKQQIERIIKSHLNKNPDLKYYINNEYIEEILSLLVDGISDAFEQNNKKITDDIIHEIKKRIH